MSVLQNPGVVAGVFCPEAMLELTG